jgi:hypothetical protein
VDDIFWHLGFKSAEHAEKVASQIINVVWLLQLLWLFWLLQVRIMNQQRNPWEHMGE